MPSQLRAILLKRRKSDMIEFYQNHPECFEEAMEMALSKEEPFCWRAAWMISGNLKKKDARIAPYIPKILALLPEFEDGHQRELLKILAQLELNEEYEGQLLDFSIELWEQTKKQPSVRHTVFTIMYKAANKYPELVNEILVLTQPQYLNTLSPGVKRAVLKMAEKLRN